MSKKKAINFDLSEIADGGGYKLNSTVRYNKLQTISLIPIRTQLKSGRYNLISR